MEKSLVGVLLTFLIILIVKTSLLNAQTPSIENRVFVLGNSVDIDSNSSFYQNLKKQFVKTKEPFTLLLIGDLLNQKFNKGAQSTELNQITRIIDLIQQFPNGKLVIIPGDRDWNQSGKGGYQRVIKLEKQIKSYLESNDYKRVKWAIKKGCPGPKKIKLNENLTLIAINTQWWNHPYDKPQPSDGTCKIITHHDFLEELDDIIEENKNKNVILADTTLYIH